MKAELILITGETETGKTWLANLLWLAFGQCAKIWDEPEINAKFLKEQRLFRQYHGRAIITITDPSKFLEKLIPDRIIELKTQI